MKRTQISLPETDFEALRSRAAREERSISDILRELVRNYLHPRRTPAAREDRRHRLADKLDAIARAVGERGKGLRGEDHDEIYD